MNRCRRKAGRALAPLLAGACAALPALARSGATAPSNARSRIDTLGKALERVPWDAARRGALLVADPENTRPAPKAPPLPPPRSDGYLLRTVAARFGRKVVALSTLTVLAPTTMVVLNTKPGPLDILSRAGLTDRMGLLLSSLSAAQWRQITGPQGLGLADLSPEQQPFFRLLLPGTFHFQKGHKKENRRVLSPGERERVRLRVNRAAEMTIRVANEENLVTLFGRHNSRPFEDTFRLVQGDEDEESPANTRVPLRQVVPSRPKPSQLAFDAPALNTPVSLSGAVTLGDLVRRVGQATRLELYADPRVAKLAVGTRGTSARAGDVLRALCLAVTGTFRKVGYPPAGAAFVLTDDFVGIGTRYAALSEWLFDSDAAAEEAAGAVEEAWKRGFNQLWVEAPEAGGNVGATHASPLHAAITAGKEKNLPVFAVVRLLKTASKGQGDAAADFRDVNLLGETSGAYARRRAASPAAKKGGYMSGAIEHILGHSGDWARFDTPVLAAQLTRRLTDLANTPCLAGLVLRDSAGPGYTVPGDDDWYSGLRDSGDFGYTPELRLAFLRQESYDPVDLSFSGSWRAGADLSLPFFPDNGAPPRVVSPGATNAPVETPVQRWRAFRYKANTRFMEQLFAALRRARPELALFVQDRANAAFRGHLDWYGSWDKADALPDPSPNPHGNDPPEEQTARSRSKRTLKNLTFAPSESLQDHWSGIQSFLNYVTPTGWDGIVFDMSEMRFDKAVSLLEGLLAPADLPPTPASGYPLPQREGEKE